MKIYDHNVQLSKLIGSNRSYIDQHLPHISALLCNTAGEVIGHGQTILVVHKVKEVLEHKLLLQKKHVIDLVRMEELRDLPIYEGINW